MSVLETASMVVRFGLGSDLKIWIKEIWRVNGCTISGYLIDLNIMVRRL
jgi:hypothetical protein